jgi:putative ABC transport system ATP-binding protein
MITLENLNKTYRTGSAEVAALREVTLQMDEREFVALMGPSGSGKSTLMNILGCLDTPTSGRYLLDGRDLSAVSEEERASLRNRKIGFVFQSFHLQPRYTAAENVALPLFYARVPRADRPRRAREALERVGLGPRAGHRPNALSGGECQRVAIARALVNRPSLLLADEPTGNLDSQTGGEILTLFHRLNEREGLTVVLVTHDPHVASKARRVIHLKDGGIVKDDLSP